MTCFWGDEVNCTCSEILPPPPTTIGTTWVNRYEEVIGNITDWVAISSDSGQYLAYYNGYVDHFYFSSNYGATFSEIIWTVFPGNMTPKMSADGSRMLVMGTTNKKLALSSAFCTTFSVYTHIYNIVSYTGDATLATVYFIDSAYGNIYKSTNYGASFTFLYDTAYNFDRIKSSGNGLFLVGTKAGIGNDDNGVYVSTNGGTSWGLMTATIGKRIYADNIYLSYTGDKILIIEIDYPTVRYLTSNDGLSTVTEHSFVTSGMCMATMSSNGSTGMLIKQVGAGLPPEIYTTNDYFATMSLKTITGLGNGFPTALASSADGLKNLLIEQLTDPAPDNIAIYTSVA